MRVFDGHAASDTEKVKQWTTEINEAIHRGNLAKARLRILGLHSSVESYNRASGIFRAVRNSSPRDDARPRSEAVTRVREAILDAYEVFAIELNTIFDGHEGQLDPTNSIDRSRARLRGSIDLVASEAGEAEEIA